MFMQSKLYDPFAGKGAGAMGELRDRRETQAKDGEHRSRFGDVVPHLQHEAWQAPPVQEQQPAQQAKPDKNPAAGVSSDDAQIKVPDAAVPREDPPSYKEALQWRRGEVNDHLAARDREGCRAIQWFWNSAVAFGGARWIEPATSIEATQLQNIRNLMQTADGTGYARLVRDEQALTRQITRRGMWRGPLAVTGVVAADYAVDKLLFPGDHIKYGTFIADNVIAPLTMFGNTQWRYKALAMIGTHIAGRVYDRFIQGDEATNNGKPRPRWERSVEIDRALKGVKAADPSSVSTDIKKPVYTPPNAELIQKNADADKLLREQNANQQKQNQDQAQKRYQAFQEAMQRWRQDNPAASTADESHFMRQWYRQNRN
jgi:hypothetical protein